MTALVWTAAAALVAAAVALLLRNGRTAPVFPLADAVPLGRSARHARTLAVVLAASATAVLLVFVVQARGQSAQPALLDAGSGAVVVVDLSSSTRASSKAIARVLGGLTRDPNRRLGLVVFSNSAYEALPPSTPADGLKGWLDRFARGTRATYPWSSFSNGTTISTGLVLARRILRRDGVSRPHVVLVSDLADTQSDLDRLETVVAQYQRESIDLRIVRVGPRTTTTAPVLPDAAFVEHAASLTVTPHPGGGGDSRLGVLAALLATLALLAALNELAFHPLTWRTAS